MKTIKDVLLEDLLPESLTHDHQMATAAAAVDPQLRAVAGVVDVVAIYAHIDELTSEQLDHFAVGRNLTTWRESWPLDLKRSVAKSIIAQKARMGTLSAVKNVLASLGSAVSIVEWWQESPKSAAHTFKITATLGDIEGTLAEQMQEDFFLLLDASKPVRSHYTFTLSQNVKGGIQVGGAASTASFARASGQRKPWRLGIQIGPVIRPVSVSAFQVGRKAVFCHVRLANVLRVVAVA